MLPLRFVRELLPLRAATPALEVLFHLPPRCGTPMTYSSADAIADLRKLWGAEGNSGQLTDITSYRRLKLINDFQTEQAYSYGRWKQDLEDPEILDEYPAWEFVRVEPRQVPRSDWWERWQAAGAAINWEGATPTAMAALKTSPIWAVFSRFGTPYPPFDFNSGMGLRDLDHEEAESLGLIPQGWNPETEGPAAIKNFNDNVEASIKDLDPSMRDWLEKAMGDRLKISGNKAILQQPIQANAKPATDNSTDAQQQFTRSEKALKTVGRRVLRTKEDRRLEAENRYTASAQTASVAAGLKPLYHEQLSVPVAQAIAEALRSTMPSGIRVETVGPHLYVWNPDKLKISLAQIHKQMIQGRGGQMLGYGADFLQPNTVLVQIYSPTGRLVSGFYAPRESAEKFATERTMDFTLSTGKPHQAKIFDR